MHKQALVSSIFIIALGTSFCSQGQATPLCSYTTAPQVLISYDKGAYANSSFSLNSNSTVQAFSSYGSNYILMTTNSQFFSFNTNFNNTIIIGNLIFYIEGNASVASSTMVACPQSLYIVTG